ncbi:MAG: hypothetical protein ABI678_08650 [Kofleriaceae bacterium]
MIAFSRRRLHLCALAIAVAIVALWSFQSRAELDNHVFTSRVDRIRLVVPRGWRESDAPSYPGLLLWLMRPDAKIVLTAEPFTRPLYCSWPVTCRTSHEVNTIEAKLACALRQKLTAEGMRIGPIQAGPKENQEAGLASVWFDYDDGKHFMRQAVALGEDRAFSLVLAANSNEARNGQVRPFEQLLRTLRPLTEAELGAPPAPGTALAPGDAALAPGDAAPNDAAAAIPSAPAAKVNPIGSCTQ